jgi:hypothetical protein
VHLVIRYHQAPETSEESMFPPGQDWHPTWQITGPDEQSAEANRGAHVSLTGQKRLPIVKPGEALRPGEIYLDLKQPAHGPFRALEGQTAGQGNAYIAQGNLTPELWNQLVRVCARAGELVLDAERCGASCEVTIVMEPPDRPTTDASRSPEPAIS